MSLTVKPSCTAELPGVDETLQVGPACTEDEEPEDEIATPSLTLDVGSTSSAIIIQWSQASEPDSTQLWRSVNGGAFALLQTVDGAVVEAYDNEGLGPGDVWCYKVRGVVDGVNGEWSNVGCAVLDMIFPGVGAVSLPTWMIAFGDLSSDDPTLVTSLDLSGMKRVTGNLYADASQVLEEFNLDALQILDKALHLSGSLAITELNLPALTTASGGTPVLVMFGGITPMMISMALLCDNCPMLETVSIPLLQFQNLHGYLFDSCALSVATVEHILARAVASGVISAFITLDGGGSAGYSNLSPQGQSDYDDLVAAGNEVSVNP